MGKLKEHYHDQLMESYEDNADWEEYVNSTEEEWWEHEDEAVGDGEGSEVED